MVLVGVCGHSDGECRDVGIVSMLIQFCGVTDDASRGL